MGSNTKLACVNDASCVNVYSVKSTIPFLIPIMSRWLASPSAITASTTIFAKNPFSHPQASSLMWLQPTSQATSCLLSSFLQCSLPALTLCSLTICCCVECMYYALQMDNIFHIQFCIPQKTLRSRTPQLAAGCTMLRSFMIVAPSLEMVVGVVSFSSSWMSLSITQGPRVVSIASTTARHAFMSATACLQMQPSPPSTE